MARDLETEMARLVRAVHRRFETTKQRPKTMLGRLRRRARGHHHTIEHGEIRRANVLQHISEAPQYSGRVVQQDADNGACLT